MGKAGGWGLTRMAYSGDALRPYRWVHFWRSWDHVRKVTLRNAVFEDFRFSKIFDKYIIYRQSIRKKKEAKRRWNGSGFNCAHGRLPWVCTTSKRVQARSPDLIATCRKKNQRKTPPTSLREKLLAIS